MKPILVSIELTNYCAKGCSFCYSKSTPEGQTFWTPDVLAPFIKDLAANGIEAVSFGGGEPLQYPYLWDLLDRLKEVPIFKSMTTNGLNLTPEVVRRLSGALNKVHVSLHYPERPAELSRVIRNVLELAQAGLKSGVNFLIKGKDIEAEKAAVRAVKAAGLTADRVVFLPLRGKGIAVDMATFKDVAGILSPKFQSMFCLLECKKSERFVSVNWEGRVGWCSYTEAKTRMTNYTYDGMLEALHAKELVYCG